MSKAKKIFNENNSLLKRSISSQNNKTPKKKTKNYKNHFEKKSSQNKNDNKNPLSPIIDYFSRQSEEIKLSKKKQFSFFLVGFLVSYLLMSLFVGFIPEMMIKELVGASVGGILATQGLNVKTIGEVECKETMILGTEYASQCYSFQVEDKQILISWLCTGVLEIIVLASAMIASIGVCWKKKIIGIIFAISLGAIFNLIRIIVTINFILTQDMMIVELAHDIIFRIILFSYIVALYIIWFHWAAKEKND